MAWRAGALGLAACFALSCGRAELEPPCPTERLVYQTSLEPGEPVVQAAGDFILLEGTTSRPAHTALTSTTARAA